MRLTVLVVLGLAGLGRMAKGEYVDPSASTPTSHTKLECSRLRTAVDGVKKITPDQAKGMKKCKTCNKLPQGVLPKVIG